MHDQRCIGIGQGLGGGARVTLAGLLAVADEDHDTRLRIFLADILRRELQDIGDRRITLCLDLVRLGEDRRFVRGEPIEADQELGITAIMLDGRRLVAIGAQGQSHVIRELSDDLRDGGLGRLNAGLTLGKPCIHAARGVDDQSDALRRLRGHREGNRRGERGAGE